MHMTFLMRWTCSKKSVADEQFSKIDDWLIKNNAVAAGIIYYMY